MSVPRDKDKPAPPGQPSSAGEPAPDAVWEREANVVTRDTPSAPAFVAAGGLHRNDGRLTEERARQILDARFYSAGAILQRDYTLREGELVATLDGYDPARAIGYAYVSDSDADVVTDLDAATESALSKLGAAGKAHVLVIHDSDIPSADVLERVIDGFFHNLPRR